jgi:hypothetical protein
MGILMNSDLYYRLQQEAEGEYEPWRQNVKEVSATMLECRSALANAGLKPTVKDLIDMARLSLELRGRIRALGANIIANPARRCR